MGLRWRWYSSFPELVALGTRFVASSSQVKDRLTSQPSLRRDSALINTVFSLDSFSYQKGKEFQQRSFDSDKISGCEA